MVEDRPSIAQCSRHGRQFKNNSDRRHLLVVALATSAVAVAVLRFFAAPLPAMAALDAVIQGFALFAATIVVGGLLRVSHRHWHQHGYAKLRRIVVELSDRWWPSSNFATAMASAQGGMREQLGLACGLILSALDVVLTALLLRDVFPQNPYPMDFLDRLLPGLGNWAFYGMVASFKTGLEIWLGLVQGQTSTFSWSRWFVLAMACAFDAALALVRGNMLAQEGLSGPMVTASNVLFLGFALAIPWVAAHTGALLGQIPSTALTQLGLIAWLVRGLRNAIKALLWCALVVITLPLLLATLFWLALASIWLALEETVAVICGDESPPPDSMDNEDFAASNSDLKPLVTTRVDVRSISPQWYEVQQ